jgi:hypothetical protein
MSVRTIQKKFHEIPFDEQLQLGLKKSENFNLWIVLGTLLIKGLNSMRDRQSPPIN